MSNLTFYVHPLAFVSGDCAIGEGTKIWQFASVIRGASLGKNCNVASGALFDASHCGDNVIFGMNVAIGPGFQIGNDVFIGPNVTFANDRWPRAHKIGFDADLLRKKPTIIVEDGASIGANSVILPGLRLGEKCMIAAGTVVRRDVPAWHLVMPDGTMKQIESEPLSARMRFPK